MLLQHPAYMHNVLSIDLRNVQTMKCRHASLGEESKFTNTLFPTQISHHIIIMFQGWKLVELVQ